MLQPSRCGEGGHAGGLEGPKPPGATCPPIGPRWRTCSSPTSVARGAGQVAWRGRSHLAPPAHPSGPGGARAPALHVWRGGRGRWLGGGRSPWRHPSAHMATGGVWNLLQVLFALFAHGHRRRKPSAPGAFCTVLPMSTGGVSHLLQVLFALFCSWSKWLKPPAFLCKRL